jgi:hypothetical protein
VHGFLAQDLGAIAAFHEIAESGLGDHIRCLYFPVHDCAYTSLFLGRMITLSSMDTTKVFY